MSNFASPAKPVSIGGGVSVAPSGTALPTTTDATLDSGFTALGYISTDGVKRSRSDSSSTLKVWGGQPVAVTDEGYEEIIQFTVVDVESIEAAALAYGESTGTMSTGITTKSKGGQRPVKSYVVDMLLKDNAKKRLVIPCGVVTAVGETVYKEGELIGTPLTIGCLADSSGYTVYEYTKAAAAASSSNDSGGSGSGSGTGT